jgi:dTDP-4-amino-4,6-dideoxygalactose transaminase
MQCALGRLQLDHLPAILARRGAVAPAYHRRPSGQAGLELRSPACASGRMSSSVDAEHLPSSLDGRERDRVVNTALRHSIGCGGHFAPIHAIPSLRGLYRHRRDDFPLGEDPARSYPVLPFRNRLAGVAPGES